MLRRQQRRLHEDGNRARLWQIRAGEGALLRIPTRETVTELQGVEPVGRVLEDAYVCDLADVSALEIGDGTLAVAYKGGQRNEFELHEGTAVEIGDQAVPVENLLELRVAS